MSAFGKESAVLEREAEAQRHKIEERIDQIRERLSPGQLIDELMSYTKDGGQHFAANLGQAVTSNPLPAALLGVSLVWLMSGNGANSNASRPSSARADDSGYPYATVTGGLRRTSHVNEGDDSWYSTFADDAGKTYRARSNAAGERAGHFADEGGKLIGGFIDETGHRLKDIKDEAGNRFSDAAGWASHAWSDATNFVSDTAGQLTGGARDLAGAAGVKADHAASALLGAYQKQPLVGGALAFAVGAALAASLPHTPLEDTALGELSDKVKEKASAVAADAYDEGKDRAAELYEKGKESVGAIVDDLGKDAPTAPPVF